VTSVTPYVTSSTLNFVQQSAVTVSGGVFTANLAADSVTTFIGTAL
jgi:glucuronoarabinoxylan endo-1,4-beta-xylanase